MRKLATTFYCLCMLMIMQGKAQTFTQLQKQFTAPGREYGSAPLWVWNTKITKKEIDLMLQDFKDKAFGGVMVHPRPGLITSYLSNEWFDLFQYTVAKGKALGLDVWIYDENSYPSGFAGGHVPDQMPESYNQGQMLQITKTDTFPTDTKYLFVCVQEVNGSFKDVTSQMQELKGKTGKFYLFHKRYYSKSGWYGGFSYVDLMVKGVTEKFLEVTMKGYEKVAGNEFGKTVKGLFSDEPGIQAEYPNTVRWTPDLFSTFRQKWGYDLQPNLPSLFEEAGDWKKTRHNFYQTLLDLFIDRWSKPMYNYMEKHNMPWTGHYWEHGWPNPEHGPDNMAMYAWHQQPGIDMLFNQFNETSPGAQFGNIRSVKELASVANQLNKKRTLSETYGGGGWDLTYKDLKRLGDWEYVLGVNFLNQHLSFMTISGARKGDYPQSFSYHNPWWQHYATLNNYYTRLSFALSQGQQRNDILVIEPTTTAWSYAIHGKNHPHLGEIGNAFQAFVTTLEKAQVEYDLGSEYIIREHGKVENGKFVVGHRAYSTVVIPPGMENIDGPTFKLLKAYADKGGKVLLYEKLQTLDGAASNALSFGEVINALDTKAFPSKDFNISFSGGNLFHHRRAFADGQLIFLANSGMESAAIGQLQLKGKEVLLMDLFTGKIYDYPAQGSAGDLTIDFNVPAAGSMLLFVADKQQPGFPAWPVKGTATTVSTNTVKAVRPAANTLMIDFADVAFGDTLLKENHVTNATDVLFKKYNYTSGNPWNHEVQFKDRLVAKDTFTTHTGYTATYRFEISENVAFNKFTAVIEHPELWNKILINGKAIQPVKGKWWLDRSFGVLEIGALLKTGENTLTLSITPMSIYAEIEPVYILGDFNLAAAAKGFKIVAPQPLQLGSWKEQGLPLYGQSISYKKELSVANTGQQYEVVLGAWKGTVAEVKVNGIKAGIIFTDPNALNITKYLKKGTNQVEVIVTGSFKNLLGPHHNNPKPGIASPWHWRNIKAYPSGKDYDLYDYGLIEDFRIMQYK